MFRLQTDTLLYAQPRALGALHNTQCDGLRAGRWLWTKTQVGVMRRSQSKILCLIFLDANRFFLALYSLGTLSRTISQYIQYILVRIGRIESYRATVPTYFTLASNKRPRLNPHNPALVYLSILFFFFLPLIKEPHTTFHTIHPSLESIIKPPIFLPSGKTKAPRYRNGKFPPLIYQFTTSHHTPHQNDETCQKPKIYFLYFFRKSRNRHGGEHLYALRRRCLGNGSLISFLIFF